MAEQDATKTLGAEVREISGISQNCAIAVRYDGMEEWYSAQKREYAPQTLGELVGEMGLKEDLDVGPVYYSYPGRACHVSNSGSRQIKEGRQTG